MRFCYLFSLVISVLFLWVDLINTVDCKKSITRKDVKLLLFGLLLLSRSIGVNEAILLPLDSSVL